MEKEQQSEIESSRTTRTVNNTGDCKKTAADSTTAGGLQPAGTLSSSSVVIVEQLQQVTMITSTTSVASGTVSGAPTPPTSNNNVKLKSNIAEKSSSSRLSGGGGCGSGGIGGNLSSSTSSNAKTHQFRAPQQYVHHRKPPASASTTKKKTWNKRQNKCHNNLKYVQQQQQKQNHPVNTTTMAMPHSKADLENIQNIKNQIGGHHHPQQQHHHQHQHHHNHQHHHHHNHRLGGQSSCSIGGGICCGVALEKNSHQKQQIYKKMLTHKNHHHLLGGATNGGGGVAGNCSNGGGNGGSTVGGCAGGGGGGVNIAGICGGGGTGKDGGNNGQIGIGNTSAICGGVGNQSLYCCRSKFFLPDKRPRTEVIIPPTKFLLGGNISDPLNLNSLQNEALNNSNNNTPATTPRQSPMTTPPKVEVIIPPNIHDPLHLLDPVDSREYEKQLTSPMKRKFKTSKSKHRHRKKKPKRRRFESMCSSVDMTDDENGRLPPPPAASSTSSKAATLVNTILSTTTDASLSLVSLGSSNVSSSFSSAKANATSACAAINTTTTTTENSSGIGVDFEENTSVESAAMMMQSDSSLLASLSASSEKASLDGSSSVGAAKMVEVLVEGAASSNNTYKYVAAADGNIVADTAISVVEYAAVDPDAGNMSPGANCLAVKHNEKTSTPAVKNVSTQQRRSLDRERVTKDLRLDLGCLVAAAPNSTSLSSNNIGIVVAAEHNSGCAGVVQGGRKRKISEGNTSQKNKHVRRLDSMDKIVSPVVPQPGAWKRPPRTVPTGARKSTRHRSTEAASETELLSPTDEIAKVLYDSDSIRGDTPDIESQQHQMKVDSSVLKSVAHENTPLSTSTSGTITTGSIEAATTSTKIMASPAAVAAVTAVVANVPIKMPKFRVDGVRYQYGNYDRYSGYRHLNEFTDVRLQVFQRHVELFQNKDILDIGCNVGHMTITVARNLAPKSILGIDIDKDLIARARRNLSMYVRIPVSRQETDDSAPVETIKQEMQDTEDKEAMNSKKLASSSLKKSQKCKFLHRRRNHHNQHQHQHHHHPHPHPHHHHHHHYHHHINQQHKHQNNNKLHVDAAEFFPVSFPLTYGGIPVINRPDGSSPLSSSGGAGAAVSANASTPSATTTNTGIKLKNDFPKNVFFRQTNYVLKDEAQLNNDTQQYDLIMCLSVTKWIHLNFGDNGLKMAFKRMFNQLRPGGKLILEAQNWASYKKKKNLTETIYNNYRNIEFFPNKFHEYLLSTEVGFSHSYNLGVPRHLSKGFCRPIQLYAKGDYTPNHIRWSDAYNPQTPYEAYRGIYATMPPRPPYPMSSSTYDTPCGNSGSYSYRQTPMHQPTSQYYNPLETDSYLPSYDVEVFNQLYVFASPLYQTVWSPPASLRNSSSHTPLFGSVREVEIEEGSNYHRHVYPPNDETSSPNANGGAFNSIRDPDTDDSNQPTSVQHVYANCESSSSPHVNDCDAAIDGIVVEESSSSQLVEVTTLSNASSGGSGGGCDSN